MGLPPLYPNAFIVLVSEPSVGKGVVINAVEAFWKSTRVLKVAPTTASKAGLVDALSESKRMVAVDGPDLACDFSSLQVPATEFGNLVPAYDLPFMNLLNDIYDCRGEFRERLRGRGEDLVISNPQLTILGGTQPAYLSAMMPEAAWGQGFTSRTVLIYSEEAKKRSLFNTKKPPRELKERLEADLARICDLYGEFEWEAEAAEAMDAWHLGGGLPVPEHGRLKSYIGRRTTHLAKLAMVVSLSRGDDLRVTLVDFKQALSYLLAAEEEMPKIFRAMVMSGDAAIIHDASLWLREEWQRSGQRAIPRHRLVHFLQQRIAGPNVLKIVEVMLAAGLIELASVDGKGSPSFRPGKDPSTGAARIDPQPKPGPKTNGHMAFAQHFHLTPTLKAEHQEDEADASVSHTHLN